VITLAYLPTWAQATPQNQPKQGIEESKGIMGRASNRPLVFLCNKMLPPMIYMQDGKRVGIVVDLAEAIKRHINRPVNLKYMDWSQAQQLVLEGKADAVFHINPSEKRKKLFDFSDDLLESEFSIFLNHDSKDIFGPNSLRGLQVGVLNKGLCFNLLNQDPLINLVTYPEILPGFLTLSKGGLDAIVMDRQVGTFLLAENNIRGIKIAGDPIDRSASAIAVKKGNTDMLVEINRALAEIKRNGTYSEIMAKWEPKEVVFQTREQSRRQKTILFTICAIAGTAFAMVVLFMIWTRSLKHKVRQRTSELVSINESLEAEVAERKKVENSLRDSRDYLKNLTDSMGDVVFSIKMPERNIEWINDRFEILGYEPEECIGKGTDFLYADGNDYQAMGEMLAKAIAESEDVIYTEAELRRKNGEIFPVEATITPYRVNNEVVSLTGIVRDVSARKLIEEKLLEYQKRLKTLASQLTIAEEKERRRIATDLHDDICQSLALTRIQVSAARKKTLEPALKSKLEEIAETLQQTLQNTRLLMADLSSPSMSEFGLSAAISELLEETVAKRHDIEIEFFNNFDDHRRQFLEDKVRAILFRNVRELVTNVLKHARANKVSVHIKEEDGQLNITVKDDGIGFNPDKLTQENGQDSGYGLFSIDERMSDLGGTFEMVSRPDSGSKAILTVPIRTR
jgi:PAS domain S-box-containing protein